MSPLLGKALRWSTRTASRPTIASLLSVMVLSATVRVNASSMLASGPSTISIELYDNRIVYTYATIDPLADAGSIVASELVRADGTRIAGNGVATDGSARIDGALVSIEVRFGDRGTRIIPGDVVAIANAWETERLIVVPRLVADFDPSTGSIHGRADAGVVLEIALDVCSTRWSCQDVVQSVTTSESGAFDLPLDRWVAAGELGTLNGTVTYRRDATTAFVVRIARVDAVLEIGATSIGGYVTAGSAISVTGLTPDVSVRRTSILPYNSNQWSAELRGALAVASRLVLNVRNDTIPQEYSVFTSPTDLLIQIGRVGTVRLPSSMAGAGVRIRARSAGLGTRDVVATVNATGVAEYDARLLMPSYDATELTHEIVVQGIRMRRRVYVPGLRFLLGTGFMAGVLEPSSSIYSMSVWNALGQAKTDRAILGRSGEYLNRTMNELTFEAGDRLQLDSSDGDPTNCSLPPIAAAYQSTGQTLHGDTRPGSIVIVTVRGGKLTTPTNVSIRADATGSFELALADYGKPGSPLSGTAEVLESQFCLSYVTWAQPWIAYDLDGGFVDASIPAGLSHIVSTSGSRPESIVSLQISRPMEEWFENQLPPLLRARLYGYGSDRGGIRSGDQISITSGVRALSWAVPQIQWHVQSGDVTITTTMPLVAATVCVEDIVEYGAECEEATLRDDTEVAVRLDVSRQHVSRMRVELIGVDQTVRAWFTPPIIEADMDSGSILIHGLADETAKHTLTIHRASGATFETPLHRSAYGAATTVRGGLIPGDTLSVIAPNDVLEVRTMVPDLRVVAVEGPRVKGVAEQPAIAQVSIVAGEFFIRQKAYERPALGQALAIPDSQGRFAVSIIPERDLSNSAALKLRSVTRSGHVFVMRHLTPMLFVESNGKRICGYVGSSLVDVAIERKSAVGVSQYSRRSDRLGAFSVDVDANSPITTGDRITMTAGTTLLSTTVPAIVVQRPILRGPTGLPDDGLEYGVFAGRGPALTPYYYLFEADVCMNSESTWVSDQVTFADGGFSETWPSTAMGREDTFVFDPTRDGSWIVRKFVWWGMQVYPERGEIKMLMSRWNTARFTVRDPQGILRATQVLRTRDAPSGTVNFPMIDHLERGDDVEIHVDGYLYHATIPSLQFDWSPGTDVIGSSDVAAKTVIELRFEGGAIEPIVPIWGNAGQFVVRKAAIEQVEALRGARVAGVRVTLHASPVADVIVESMDLPDMRDGRRVYLPFGMVRRNSTASSVR